MTVWVIDGTGKPWARDSRAYRDHFFLWGIEGDTSAPVVDKLGGIKVSFPRSSPIIRFNPATVEQPAIARLAFWLRRQTWDRHCLAYGPSEPNLSHRIYPWHETLLAMQALIEEVRGPIQPYASMTEDFGYAGRVPELAPIFELWKARGGVYTEADYRQALRRFAHDRYVLLTLGDVGRALEFVEAGSGLHIPDRQSHASLAGAKVDAVAGAYGPWTGDIYRGALARQQPQLDRLYAEIDWPRAGRVQRRYLRVILPCRGKDGRQYLLGVSSDHLGAPDLDAEAA